MHVNVPAWIGVLLANGEEPSVMQGRMQSRLAAGLYVLSCPHQGQPNVQSVSRLM